MFFANYNLHNTTFTTFTTFTIQFSQHNTTHHNLQYNPSSHFMSAIYLTNKPNPALLSILTIFPPSFLLHSLSTPFFRPAQPTPAYASLLQPRLAHPMTNLATEHKQAMKKRQDQSRTRTSQKNKNKNETNVKKPIDKLSLLKNRQQIRYEKKEQENRNYRTPAMPLCIGWLAGPPFLSSPLPPPWFFLSTRLVSSACIMVCVSRDDVQGSPQ